MPIDNEDERRAGIATGQPGVAPIEPDGSIDRGDRGALSGVYVPGAFSSGVLGGLSINMFGDGMCYTYKR